MLTLWATAMTTRERKLKLLLAGLTIPATHPRRVATTAEHGMDSILYLWGDLMGITLPKIRQMLT
ncbi:hypothetical protein SXM_1902 [Shewanella xiamenensis]|nr:hypothetical protein SXM_1902 [Shewanella xiamenensis]